MSSLSVALVRVHARDPETHHQHVRCVCQCQCVALCLAGTCSCPRCSAGQPCCSPSGCTCCCQLVLVTGLHYVLLHGLTHAGMVPAASHYVQVMVARARVVGSPRTLALPVVDEAQAQAVSPLQFEGCGTSLPQPPRIRFIVLVVGAFQLELELRCNHTHTCAHAHI